MDISGKMKIWKNEKGNYSTSISNKKDDGTYENAYLQVNFKKGVEVGNGQTIDVKNAFLTFYKVTDKHGEEKIIYKIVVTDFTSDDTLRYADGTPRNDFSPDELPF